MMILSSILLSLPLIVYAASGQGSVSLYSDSQCDPQGDTSHFGERDPLALNYTLSADTCGTFGGTAHSYLVTERPTCNNGTTAAFAFYSSPGCSQADFDTPAGQAMNEYFAETEFDGECLALVAFNSVAFICDGVGQGGSNAGQGASSASAGSSSTSPTTAVSSTTTVGSATPIAPGVTPTTPLYTHPASSFSAGHAPSGRVPSTGASSHPSNPTTPSQPIFTGAAVSERGGSLVGIMAALGAALVI